MIVTEANLKSVRPGYGMQPKYLPELIENVSQRIVKLELEQGMIYFSKNENELKKYYVVWYTIFDQEFHSII